MSELARFFDKLSRGYNSRYSKSHPYLNWFFSDRILKSIPCNFPTGSKVLDIGAGTGALYDYLITHDHVIDYYAVDISFGMLSESSIPIERRFVGSVYDVPSINQCYDSIFCLGVTSYLTQDEVVPFIEWQKDHVDNGFVIVSFSNRYSVGMFFYLVFKWVLSFLRFNNNVIGLQSSFSYLSISEALELFDGFECEISLLNQGVFPLTKIFPRLSVFLAVHFFSRLPFHIQKFFSSDFLIKAKRIN